MVVSKMLLLIKHEVFVLPVLNLQHSQECKCRSFTARLTKCFIQLLFLNDLGEILRCYSNQWEAQKQVENHYLLNKDK